MKQKWLLQYNTDLLSERFYIVVADINIVDQNLAIERIVQAADKVCQRRFPAARRPGQPYHLAWLDRYIYILENLAHAVV